MRIFSTIFVLLLALQSGAAFAVRDYDALPWAEVATVSVANGETAEIDTRGARGMYVRVQHPAECGAVGFALSAEAAGFTPRMIYDRNADVWTPATRRLHFWVRQERNADFRQIWLEHVTTDAPCPMTVLVAEGDEPPPDDPDAPKVFAEGQATSDVAEYVAIDLAWNRTIAAAQSLCRTPRVRKQPGQGGCSATGVGNHWRAQCSAWFYCE